MKYRKLWKKTAGAGALVLSLAAVLGSIPVSAAATDTIDDSRTGSITIHKYDMTAADEAGAYKEGTYQATGQTDRRVEDALEGYEIEGVEFSYLRVGDVETHCRKASSETSISLVYEIPKELMQILNLKAADAVDMSAEDEAYPCRKEGVYHFTGQQISDALSSLLAADNVAAKNKLEDYLETSDLAEAMPDTDGKGLTSVSGLDLGLYLIVETEVPEDVIETVNPWFVQLPFTDAEGEQWVYDMVCYPKNQTGNPTLDKEVRSMDDTAAGDYHNTATASEGDILDYMISSKLPTITSTATYLTEYTFTDRLSAGLTYNRDAKIYFYHTAEDAESNNISAADLVWNSNEAYFTEKYTESTDPDSTSCSEMVISLTKEGLAEANQRSGYYMVVSYTAVLNSNAQTVLGDEGNPNDVQLLWRRTSDSHYNTLEDRNYVYSYGINLNKYFSDEQGDYSKVRFVFRNMTDHYYLQAKQISDGLYYVTGQTADEKDAALLIPNSKTGTLIVEGMEADYYELTEAATDSGYSLLKAPIDVEITATDREIVQASVTSSGKTEMTVGEIQDAAAEVDGKEAEMTDLHASVVLGVTNTKGFLLPQTGGSGMYFITILGVLIAACGCRIIFAGKKNA